MEKSIKYGIRTPESEGDFDRRPVVNNVGKKPGYDFGERPSSGMPIMKKVSITYFSGEASKGGAGYAKQKKMQGKTGGQGRGGDHFGSPKGSKSSLGSKGDGQAKQKKGFGGQTTTQYS